MTEDLQTTTEPPSQGFIITTTAMPSQTTECLHNGIQYIDGELINTDQPCEHCYCMRGDIVCAVQDCGRPLEMHSKNCTARLPKEGECCPQIYECESDAESTSTISSATTLEYENVHTTTQGSSEWIDNSGNAGKLNDQTTEKIDESENEIHDKDYDHITAKPSRNITAQQAAGSVDDRIEKQESTTIFNELEDAVASTVAGVSSTISHDTPISTVIPIINKLQVVTEKDEESVDKTTESKGIFNGLYTTVKSVVDYTTTLGSAQNKDESHDILSSADGSLLSNVIPGEGDCLENGITYSNNTNVPSRSMCEKTCVCYNSIVHCEEIRCTVPINVEKCVAFYEENQCCPIYECDDSATTLAQKLDSQTEAAMNEENFAGIAETTSHPFVHSPISSKLDNTLETKPDETEADKIPFDSEKVTIELEKDQQSTSSPSSDEQILPELIQTEIFDTEVTTSKGKSPDIEFDNQPETLLETTEHTIENTTSYDSLEDHSPSISDQNLPEQQEFDLTEKVPQNDYILPMEAPEPPAIQPEITTVESQKAETTTLKVEVIEHDDEQDTTVRYEEQHPPIDTTQSNEKLPIETIFEQATTEKESEIESIYATTVRFIDEPNKENSVGNVEKNDDGSVDNEVLELTTQQPAQEEVATEHRVESVSSQQDTTVSMPQENSQDEDKSPGIIALDERLEAATVASETSEKVDTKPEDEIPSPNGEKIFEFNKLITQSQPIDEHTPPPVAIERDESITESFNQEMAPTHAPVESSPSTEFTVEEKPSEYAESQNFESEHQTISSTIFSVEPEATTAFSSKVDLSGVNSNDFKDGEVNRPDEKGSIDFDETFQPTEKHEEATDKSNEEPQKPNIAQENKSDVTTIDNEKSGLISDVPFHSSDSIEETTASQPTNKDEESVNSISTEASVAGTTYDIPSKQEDLEIITEKIDVSKQEDLNIVTSTSAAEETTARKDTSSESSTELAKKKEQVQAEYASMDQIVPDLSATQSNDFKQKPTEITTLNADSGPEQSSTIQDEQQPIESSTVNNESGSEEISYIGEEQSTTIDIISEKSTESNELATEDAERIESPTTQTAQKQSQEIGSQHQLNTNGGIQSTSNDALVTTELDEPTTSVSNLNRIGDHEAEQEGFTTEKLNQEAIAQNELQPSKEAVEYDITTLLNKIHDHGEITTLGNVESEATTQKSEEVTKEASLQLIDEQTERNVEHSTQHDDNQSDKIPSAEKATTSFYDEEITANTPTKLHTVNNYYSDNIFKPQETSEDTQSTENIHEEINSSDKYTTSQSLVEESSTHSFAHYSPVELAPESPETITTYDQPEVTTSRQDGINMSETQTNRMPIDQETPEKEGNIATIISDIAEQESIGTTVSSNRVSEGPIISHDEYPQETHSENTEDQTITESTILGTTTPKSVVDLITTLHPMQSQQFESTSVNTIEAGSTELAGSTTPIQEKIESYESSTLQPNNAIDQNINPEYQHYDENKTAEAVTVATQSNVNVPPESANNIPLIRDPLPDRFDEITTKLAENFDTTTLPSILFSHTYSDSTTVKNTQNEIKEPSSHISEGPLPNQTDHDIESQPHAPTYAQPQAPSYDNSGTYPSQYPDEEYTDEDEPTVFGPGTCRYGGKLYVSAQQIPRDDSCDFCFCFRSDIICLQQSCPPPIVGCREEPISGFCCPRYECPVPMALVMNSTTTTTTTLPPYLSHFQRNSGKYTRSGCQVQGITYKIGERVTTASGPCIDCM